MDLQPLASRRLVAYAGPESFADGTLPTLARLGYEILTPEKFEKRAERGELPAEPDLYLVEERRLLELPAAPVPILVLAERNTAPRNDPRIRAAIKPPVGMHDLYRLLQQVLEDKPRASLRVRTALDAVCRRSGREWNARILSLSENGCLLESPESVPLSTSLQLAFELPGTGTVHLHAETAYHLVPHLGLVFSSISPQIRTAIAHFVEDSLRADVGEATR